MNEEEEVFILSVCVMIMKNYSIIVFVQFNNKEPMPIFPLIKLHFQLSRRLQCLNEHEELN